MLERTSTPVHTQARVRTDVRMHARTYVRTYAGTHQHKHAHVRTPTHTCVRTYVCPPPHTHTIMTFRNVQDTRFRAVASAVFARAFGASWTCRIRRPASELGHVCPRTSLESTRRIAAPVSERLALTRSIPRRRQPWSNRNGEVK